MLKLSLKPGEQLNIGENVRVTYRTGDGSGIKIFLEAPKDKLITRNGVRSDLPDARYYRDSWKWGKKAAKPAEVEAEKAGPS